jgi:trans-2,3-dihydro-3-hydroxyanthranilate isomerase
LTLRRFAWLDVFTARPLSGNGLAVMVDGDGLDDATMLAFTREMRLSETTFVQAADDSRADYRNRIWDPRRELAFAGHPSLGTAVAIARARDERSASYVQQTPAGCQPVEVELAGDRHARTTMLQEPAAFGPELEAAQLLAMCGLEADRAEPDLPAQVVSTGVSQVLVGVRDHPALAAARPDWPRIGALLDGHDALVLYLFCCPAGSDAVRARAFTHTQQMGEDPATGSAAGPLCAYLQARRDVESLEIEQGVEMGRPSRLSTTMEGNRPRVSGDVVTLLEGQARL